MKNADLVFLSSLVRSMNHLNETIALTLGDKDNIETTINRIKLLQSEFSFMWSDSDQAVLDDYLAMMDSLIESLTVYLTQSL